ncbi:hypothetical protein JW824_02805 [bacterium]|nr:hypothetical protein [bacterium]
MNQYKNSCLFYSIFLAICILIVTGFTSQALSQVEVAAWGNVMGIRVDGELMAFESSLRVVQPDWTDMTQTAKERQNPQFSRNGNTVTVTSRLNDLSLTEVIEDIETGTIRIQVQFTVESAMEMAGAFFCIDLPGTDFVGASIDHIDPAATTAEPPTVSPNQQNVFRTQIQPVTTRGLRITSPHRRLEVTVNEPTEIVIQQANPRRGISNTQVYFAVIWGNATEDQTAQKTFTLKVSGEIDKQPVTLVLDTSHPGRVFDGIGGNFRLQNPTTDPQVIDYCLENMNVTWGRVEMPWRYWHPDENTDPLAEARAGRINSSVHEAMVMAQRLAQKNIPVIVSAWFPPGWAVISGTTNREQGLYGDPLNPEKMNSIIRSLGGYLIYLKEAYGVEAAMFSFNESDLGINVRQTGEEHAALIKRLGSYLASKGLATKMLLGDNSDATTYSFIEPAMNDPETHKYIGAISFHSWRGCSEWVLSIWADAAERMNVPLLIGEGSIDAAAWRYPQIFTESIYTMEEINLYVRILSMCQARSILQWQLTADYSVMSGGGIFGNEEPLRPTQRFWNLKQIGLTPSGSFYLPIDCDRPNINCVAFGDIADGVYTIHMVNNGATRQSTITGLPDNVNELRIFVTDGDRGMKEGRRIPVSSGRAQFTLESVSLTTLISVD